MTLGAISYTEIACLNSASFELYWFHDEIVPVLIFGHQN